LLGGYLINEFSEIVWQDGILLKALKDGRQLIFRNMEKCTNELFFFLKQVLEKKSFFFNLKQELVTFTQIPRMIFIYNNNAPTILFNFLKANTFSFEVRSYSQEEKLKIVLDSTTLFKQLNNETHFLENVIDCYNSVIRKFKFNTRLRQMTLTTLLKYAKHVESFLTENQITGAFLSERNKMRMIAIFLHLAFFSLDNQDGSVLMKKIIEEFSVIFNFDNLNFTNYMLNFSELCQIEEEYSFIKTFENNKLYFNDLSLQKSFYNYNSYSQFYTKLINNAMLCNENILLVGETGVGKTTMIQNLAKVMNTKLNVINLSQSSDASDLFGGYKPINSKVFLYKYFEKLVNIITSNFDQNNNRKFLTSLYEAYEKDVDYFIKFALKAIEKIEAKLGNKGIFEQTEIELKKLQNSFKKGCYNAFTYMDGILLDSLKKDEWVLLDEINLASDDLLLKLNPILQGQDIFVIENNDLEIYQRGPKFRIFGSMNPEYNIGKKRLPSEVRNSFTEFFIPEIKELHDVKTFIKTYVGDLLDDRHITEMAKLYSLVKDKQNKNEIQKINNSKCNFSLRNLSRMLMSFREAVRFYETDSALAEVIQMNFFSQINDESIALLQSNTGLNIPTKLTNKKVRAINSKEYVNFNNYFIRKEYISPENTLTSDNPDNKFILTKTFKSHLNNLLSIITLSNYAVLLEGPTSSGKTSIIEYIGKRFGQKVLRINNNQNTEVEEYIGSYTTNTKGQFYFQEGFLVKAVKEGSWIILDEINLAPSEVLEALNRLLDDNRELYISESNTVIKAHPNFRIFAAMNPSELYGGRKDLSEAFKNRFIHLYFDNIPNEDLEEIIEKRCKVAKSRVKLMVAIYNDLQKIRSSEQVFAQKEGFITIRDLLKWGSRDINSYEDLAYEGYFVIGEKLRSEEERQIIKKVIERHIQKVEINLNQYYDKYVSKLLNGYVGSIRLCLNNSSKRMITLIDKSLRNREPVLLIGETGTGKNLIIEYLNEFYKQQMITINCHENVDTSDFLGSLRSTFGREEKHNNLKQALKLAYIDLHEQGLTHLDKAISTLFNKYLNKYVLENSPKLNSKKCEKLIKFLSKNFNNNYSYLQSLYDDCFKLFEWVDGPLTTAMKNGNLLLIDEISLALDSVLERLNSVFETDRVLVLSEKQHSADVEIIHPMDSFMVVASMVPSGDHGKRELSPALRSRFSEIFINNDYLSEELKSLAKAINVKFESRDINIFNEDIELSNDLATLIKFKTNRISLLDDRRKSILNKLILTFYIWYNYSILTHNHISKTLTLRDVDNIIEFFNLNLGNTEMKNNFDFVKIYEHSINMTIIDGMFLNESSKAESLIKVKEIIIEFLNFQISYLNEVCLNGESSMDTPTQLTLIDNENYFGVNPFIVLKDMTDRPESTRFIFSTPNMKLNILKIFRGLSMHKPILLEGSPGVGKTTLVQNLARKLNKNIYRINLSEHTDMIDLIGSEYPTDDINNKGISFKWVPGIFLNALVNGDWVIIDEMNLASQSILEGFNSVLDHRRTLYVTELNKEYKCHRDFQIFATQNPVNQGGGRKYLPKSFLNRFVKIYLNDLIEEDYTGILINLFPEVNLEVITKLTSFNRSVQEIIYVKNMLNIAEVGEFNLRTLIKVLEFITEQGNNQLYSIVKLLYIARIRKQIIRKELKAIFKSLFGNEKQLTKEISVELSKGITYLDIDNNSTDNKITIESSVIKKYQNLVKLCINNNFPVILTGESSLGKKELIRYLAKQSNNSLYEFTLNSSMDSTELLGNFDKVNLAYHIQLLKDKLTSFVKTVSLETNEMVLVANFIDFLSKPSSIETLPDKLDQFKCKLLTIGLDITNEVQSINRVVYFIKSETFNFEWHDSVLIKCIINGYWIILDNVNTCSAAVLDRFNSLLDDDKQINLNECGLEEGRTVKPNKNFRIFMVMNERFGEVSRALKNRCVEIYVDKSIIQVYNAQNDSLLDFSLQCSNGKEIEATFPGLSVTLRNGLLKDLIMNCEFNYYYDYRSSLFLALVYIRSSQGIVEFRSFNKYLGLIKHYNYRNNVIESVLLALDLMGLTATRFELENLTNAIDKFFKSDANDFTFNLIRLRYLINLGYSFNDLELFEAIKANSTYLTRYYSELHKLINRNKFIKDFIWEGNLQNENDLLLLFKPAYALETNKTTLIPDQARQNYSKESLNTILKNFEYSNNFLNTIIDEIYLLLIYYHNSFHKTWQISSFELKNEAFFNFLKSKQIQTDGYDNINLDMDNLYKRFYMYKFRLNNTDRNIKKFLKEEDEYLVEQIIQSFESLVNNNNIPSMKLYAVISVLESVTNNELVKTIRNNPTTFFYILNSIISKYLLGKSDIQGNKNPEAKYLKSFIKILSGVNIADSTMLEDIVSLVAFSSSIFYSNIFYYDMGSNTLALTNKGNFDSNILFSLNEDKHSELLTQIIRFEENPKIGLNNNLFINNIYLEFDVKAAKGYSDILRLKTFEDYLEKINEVFINEKLIIPIISNKNDLNLVHTFMSNRFKYMNYLNDYNMGLLSDRLTADDLVRNNFYRKYNSKSVLNTNILKFLISGASKVELKSLGLVLSELLIYNENKHIIENILYVSKDETNLNEQIINGFGKLFLTPFYYFYRKVYSDNIIQNIGNINDLMSTSKKIEFFNRLLKTLYTELELSDLVNDVSNGTKEERLLQIIDKAELMLKFSIPDKHTLSKILGKDIFKLFFDSYLAIKRRYLLAENIILDFNNKPIINSDEDLRFIESKLKNFDKNNTNRGEASDSFISDLNKLIENYLGLDKQLILNNKSNIEIDRLLNSLKEFVNKYLLQFADLILPLAISMFLFLSALEEVLNINQDKLELDPTIITQYNDKQIINYKINHSNLNKHNMNTLISGLIRTNNTEIMTDILMNIIEKEFIKLEIDEPLPIKIKKLHNLNNKVLESTVAMDEMSKAEKEKIDEEQELKELEENFPTFRQEYQQFDKLELIQLNCGINIKKPQTSIKEINKKDIALNVYKLVSKLFIYNYENRSSLKYYSELIQTFRLNNKLKREYLTKEQLKCYSNTMLEFLYHTYHNEEVQPQLDSIDIDKNIQSAEQTYNFYKDPNPKEIKLLYLCLNKLLSKTRIYLNEYRDHPILVLITIISFNLLELDTYTTPISKVLSGLDVLLTKLQEWEIYASKKINSFSDEIHNIMLLIRRYRKIELISWRGFLNAKISEYEKQDIQNYFETIIDIALSEEFNTDMIVDTLNLFIMNSNFSSFKFRVNSVYILYRLLKHKCANQELLNALSNTYNYYTINFFNTDKFDEYKAVQLKEIEDKLKNLENIAKWDIKNYFNFRDNMKRNYKQLNKILKGFDNFCLTNVSEFIEFSTKDFTQRDFVFRLSAQKQENANFYDIINNEIFNRLANLKNLDPIFKNKALIDLIKMLKENLGFSTVYKFYQNEVYNQFKLFDINFIDDYNSVLKVEDLTKLRKSSAYIVKILEKINNFNTVESCHDDLNHKYLETMKGLTYSSFFKSLALFSKIERIIYAYNNALKKAYVTDPGAKAYEANTFIKLNEILKEYLCQLEDIKESHVIIDISNKLHCYQNGFAEFINYHISGNQVYLTNIDLGVLKNYVIQLTDLITKAFKIIQDELVIYRHRFITGNKIHKQVLLLLSSLGQLSSEKEIHFNLDDGFIRQTNKAYGEISSNPDKIDNEFDAFFLEDQVENNNDTDRMNEEQGSNNMNSESTIKVDSLIELANNLFTKISCNEISLQDSLQAISKLINLTTSILKLNNTSVSIFYNVSINGYCKPEKATGGKDNNDKGGVHEGGFGMAEGEGIEDISKQIEDEEQLLGLKDETQQSNEDKKQNNENKDTGFETKTDFKEDQKMDISEEDEENKAESVNESDIEREKDDVDFGEENKMYDKDNEINEEDVPEEEKKGKVDLTNKNVSMKDNHKDNEYKAKDENSKQNDNSKDVDKPENINKDSDNKDNNEDNSDDEGSQPGDKQTVEKLDVNKPDKEIEEEQKEGEEGIEENNNEESKGEGEIQDDKEKMQVDEEANDTKQADNAAADDNNFEMNEEDMKDEEEGQNETENKGMDEDNIGSDDEGGIDVDKKGGEEAAEDESVEDAEEIFQSKPLPTKDADLGYNPISNNKGSGGNTAQQSKDNKEQITEDLNDNLDTDRLNELYTFDQIFNLNSMMESVWQERPNKNKNNRQNKVTSQVEPQQQDIQNDICEDFDFQENKDNNNEDQQQAADFNQGYADNKPTDRKARGINKEENNINTILDKKDHELGDMDYENEPNIDIKIENRADNATQQEQKENENNDEEDVGMADYISEENVEEEDKNENIDMNIDDYIKEAENKNNNIKNNNLLIETDKEMEIVDLDDKEVIDDYQKWLVQTESSGDLDLWNKLEILSINNINKLTEHLKIALEPNKQTKLRGNYKSGKRLNIKKIISFIASNYRNDKIWLRRTLPFERNYYVTLAIDDTLSMKEHNLGFFALESLVIVSSALNKAGIGKVSICGIKEDIEIYQTFNDMFSKEKGSQILSKFKFDFSSRLSHDNVTSILTLGNEKLYEEFNSYFGKPCE
jgi:MoxR-like ATPase